MEDKLLLPGNTITPENVDQLDESYFKMPVHNTTVTFANRKISTYVNALYDAGFIIERMVEQTDEQSMSDTEDSSPKAIKAKMLPLSMCFKCRKL